MWGRLLTLVANLRPIGNRPFWEASKWSTYAFVAPKWCKMNSLVRFARKAKSGVASGKSFVFWQEGWILAGFSGFGRGSILALTGGVRQITMLSDWIESGLVWEGSGPEPRCEGDCNTGIEARLHHFFVVRT